jgi:3D (Asp-Asp-Asp) domain-containing protein
MNAQARTQREASTSLLLQRKCACGGDESCERCDDEREKNPLQRSSADRRPAPRIPQSVHNVIGNPGQPLDDSTRARLEPRFGYDFTGVRVHADAQAAASVRDVRADAYTVGRHVAFGSGRYRPGTPFGDAILAHELAHVIQQDGREQSVAIKGEDSSSALEADADQSAQTATESLWSRASGAARRIAGDAMPRLRTAARLSLSDCSCNPSSSGVGTSSSQDDTKAAPSTTTAPLPPPPSTNFVLAGATKKRWRVSYKTKAEADAQRDFVKSLRIKVDDAIEEGKLWTFDYYPLTEAEAEKERAAKEKAFGPKYDVTVKQSTRADTYYVEVLKKCPAGMDPRPGFTTWTACFPTEADANALVKKMKDAHVEAESVKVDEGRWGIYYKPMTEAEAKAAGETAAKARPGSAEGMYIVSTSKQADINSYTYAMNTACPTGYAEVGSSFRLTAYALAQEKEFAATPTVTNPCGLTGTFRQKFLFETATAPRGVKMQGSGLADNGKFIHYAAKGGADCFEVISTAGVTKHGTTPTAGRTVAVDKSQIPLGTQLLIEDIGARTAEDTGKSIKTDHIDVYYGTTKTIMEASAFEMTGKKVCKKL